MRARRVADEIHKVVGACFLGDRMADPRLQGITVTHVKVTKDLQLATIYLRLYDPTAIGRALEGLAHSKGFLRREVGAQLRMRRVPELRFFHDEVVETGARIEKLLAESRPPQTVEEAGGGAS